MLARHVVAVADERVAGLRSLAGKPVELLGTVQRAALEIAGRSMFSLETGAFGARLRDMLAEFGMRHGRVDLPDIVLPPKPAPNGTSLATGSTVLPCAPPPAGEQPEPAPDISFRPSADEIDAYDFVEVAVRVPRPGKINPFTEASVRGQFRRGG